MVVTKEKKTQRGINWNYKKVCEKDGRSYAWTGRSGLLPKWSRGFTTQGDTDTETCTHIKDRVTEDLRIRIKFEMQRFLR